PKDEAPKPSMLAKSAEPRRAAKPSPKPSATMDNIAEEAFSDDGLAMLGAIGHGAGPGTGAGVGAGFGRLEGSHGTRAPTVRMGASSVTGQLPKEVVQRIVRQNFGRFRLCYERGLASNPNLEGQVTARFVINRQGQMTQAADGGSSLPDASVVG